MIRSFVLVIALAFSSLALANDKLVGWHWYNELKDSQSKVDKLYSKFAHATPSQQVKWLKETYEKLKDRAVTTADIDDIAAFKEMQDFLVYKSSVFANNWDLMKLVRPDLDYSLEHSSSNALSPIMKQEKHAEERDNLDRISKTKGLIFFYRGKNPEDRFNAGVLKRFSARYHISLLPVSVDDSVAPDLPKSKVNGMAKAHKYGISYFPAVLLVDPKNKRFEVASYGFMSEQSLADRLYRISTNWKLRA